jgi:hypothetical protein
LQNPSSHARILHENLHPRNQIETSTKSIGKLGGENLSWTVPVPPVPSGPVIHATLEIPSEQKLNNSPTQTDKPNRMLLRDDNKEEENMVQGSLALSLSS